MDIKFIALKVSEDNNLMYFFYTQDFAFTVDATNPEILLECLKKEFTKEYYLPEEIQNLSNIPIPRKLLYSFTTHHHFDHSSGDKRLKEIFPDIKQIKGEEKDINIQGIVVKCFKTPCHTRDSICILINNKYMCTGDTIFYLGCGWFTEGTPKDMLAAINKIKQYDNNIIMLYGHNYKEKNLIFIRSECQYINHVEDDRIFLTLGEEKKENPFFLLKNEEEMGSLREKKNKFI